MLAFLEGKIELKTEKFAIINVGGVGYKVFGVASVLDKLSKGDRNDIGALWENFMIIEKMKFNAYHNIDAELYFWRTYDGNEIDLIEEKEKKLLGYEFKWNDKQKKIGKSFDWLNSYKMITKRNLGDFVFYVS